jgi:hypothetical protein
MLRRMVICLIIVGAGALFAASSSAVSAKTATGSSCRSGIAAVGQTFVRLRML